jgi:hypothetical protein
MIASNIDDASLASIDEPFSNTSKRFYDFHCPRSSHAGSFPDCAVDHSLCHGHNCAFQCLLRILVF